MELIFPLLVFAALYMLMIRPQKERMRRQQELVASLGVGDRVVTAGGVVGTITADHGSEVTLEVAPGLELTLLRPFVRDRYEPPTAATPDGPDPAGDGA